MRAKTRQKHEGTHSEMKGLIVRPGDLPSWLGAADCSGLLVVGSSSEEAHLSATSSPAKMAAQSVGGQVDGRQI